MNPELSALTPKAQGYRFPAEFERHEATWLSWPHKEASWPERIAHIYGPYCSFVKTVAARERVHINVANAAMELFARQKMEAAGVDMSRVRFFHNPTNDAWCRDHGPAFLINPAAPEPKIIVDWNYNAWGNKYPPFDLDDVVPTRIAESYGIPVYHPGIVMEGGSVDFNGAGTLLTSESCLLNPNRNPALDQEIIEKYLSDYYCVDQVLWVPDGILGDDTDGHIDDTVRFVNADTVLAVVESDPHDGNYPILQAVRKRLSSMRVLGNRQLNVIELPMPDAVIYQEQRLPASYANFYIANGIVVVPTYRCAQDDLALERITAAFPDHEVTGIDSTEIIWGLGSFHCLSQQEPEV